MNGLDLFSGIGGITNALDGYVWPVAYCEIEPYARGVLLSRMYAGDLPLAPIWDDISTLCGTMLPHIDIIYGGFPCQDISVAGRGEGLGGERSGLFFEIVRLVKEIKPSFIFLENVPNIRTKGLGRVLKELDAIGYDCRWGLLSAADVGPKSKELFEKCLETGQSAITLVDQVRHWPTPQARDWKGESNQRSLPTLLNDRKAGGTLNPTWVEWLMGYRSGWTVCEPWAMPLFRRKRVKRLKD